MGISLSAYRDKARLEYPGLTIDLGEGNELRLMSITELTDDQLDRFAAAQDKLGNADENDKLPELKRAFVDLLSEVSTDPEAARRHLTPESLGTLMEVFKDYSSTVTEGASKSGSDSESA
jgi:hypothetical protein